MTVNEIHLKPNIRNIVLYYCNVTNFFLTIKIQLLNY